LVLSEQRKSLRFAVQQHNSEFREYNGKRSEIGGGPQFLAFFLRNKPFLGAKHDILAQTLFIADQIIFRANLCASSFFSR
jgi:hypothetical protein